MEHHLVTLLEAMMVGDDGGLDFCDGDNGDFKLGALEMKDDSSMAEPASVA
jgi:hypothetical protein